jgi:hypothetical protein
MDRRQLLKAIGASGIAGTAGLTSMNSASASPSADLRIHLHTNDSVHRGLTERAKQVIEAAFDRLSLPNLTVDAYVFKQGTDAPVDLSAGEYGQDLSFAGRNYIKAFSQNQGSRVEDYTTKKDIHLFVQDAPVYEYQIGFAPATLGLSDGGSEYQYGAGAINMGAAARYVDIDYAEAMTIHELGHVMMDKSYEKMHAAGGISRAGGTITSVGPMSLTYVLTEQGGGCYPATFGTGWCDVIGEIPDKDCCGTGATPDRFATGQRNNPTLFTSWPSDKDEVTLKKHFSSTSEQYIAEHVEEHVVEDSSGGGGGGGGGCGIPPCIQ